MKTLTVKKFRFCHRPALYQYLMRSSLVLFLIYFSFFPFLTLILACSNITYFLCGSCCGVYFWYMHPHLMLFSHWTEFVNEKRYCKVFICGDFPPCLLLYSALNKVVFGNITILFSLLILTQPVGYCSTRLHLSVDSKLFSFLLLFLLMRRLSRLPLHQHCQLPDDPSSIQFLRILDPQRTWLLRGGGGGYRLNYQISLFSDTF